MGGQVAAAASSAVGVQELGNKQLANGNALKAWLAYCRGHTSPRLAVRQARCVRCCHPSATPPPSCTRRSALSPSPRAARRSCRRSCCPGRGRGAGRCGRPAPSKSVCPPSRSRRGRVHRSLGVATSKKRFLQNRDCPEWGSASFAPGVCAHAAAAAALSPTCAGERGGKRRHAM